MTRPDVANAPNQECFQYVLSLQLSKLDFSPERLGAQHYRRAGYDRVCRAITAKRRMW